MGTKPVTIRIGDWFSVPSPRPGDAAPAREHGRLHRLGGSAAAGVGAATRCDHWHHRRERDTAAISPRQRDRGARVASDAASLETISNG
jgi:hypothetical protein